MYIYICSIEISNQLRVHCCGRTCGSIWAAYRFWYIYIYDMLSSYIHYIYIYTYLYIIIMCFHHRRKLRSQTSDNNGQMETQRWEESEKEKRREDQRRKRVRRKKMQVREKVEKWRPTGKTQWIATFLSFAHLHLLSSYSFSFWFFSSSLLFPESSHLCFSSVHVVGSLTSKLPPINMVLCDGIDKEVYSSRFNHAHIDMWPAVSCVAWQSLRSNVRGMSSACRWRPM